MLPSDTNLNIKSGTVEYNNKILVSDGTFSLGKNCQLNTFELTKGGGDKPKIIHKAIIQPTITHKTYHTKRKSCFGTLTTLMGLYNVVYVSINRSLQLVNKILSTAAAI